MITKLSVLDQEVNGRLLFIHLWPFVSIIPMKKRAP